MGLGTVWILDGVEVTIVGNITTRSSESGCGIDIIDTQVAGTAAALYALGVLFFGHLTDRWGRRKLFMITLAVYLTATV